MKHDWFYSLRFRILAGCVTGLLLLFALVIFNTHKVLDEFAVENTRTLIKQTSENLNLAVVPYTTDEGLDVLGAYLNELIQGNEDGIIYLIVLDEEGQNLASSRSVPDPLPDTAVALEQQVGTGIVHVDQAILLADNRIGHLRYGLSTRLLQKTNTRLIKENLLLLGGGLMVVIILLAATGRWVGSQLGQLLKASQALADGDYDVRATITGNNEFSYLAHNFNNMAKAIAERKNLEIQLNQSESRFHTLFDQSPDPAWIIDEHKFVECNQVATVMLGYSNKDELLNTHPSKLSPAQQPDGEDSFSKAERMMDLATEKGLHRFEWVHTRADGSDFFAEVTLSAITLDDRPVIFCAWRDITDRKSSEEALRNSEERQRAITSAFPDLVFLIDEDGRYVEIISNTDDLLYAESSKMLGKTLHQVLPAKEADIFLNLVRETLKTGESQSIEYSLSVPRGRVFFEGRSAPVDTLIEGKKQVVFVARDISERKQAETALLESQSRYRGIFNESVATIYVFDHDKNFIDTNDAGLELLGYSRDELLTMSIPDVDADAGAVQPTHEHLLAGGRIVNFEHRLVRKDGSIITVLNNSMPLTDQDGDVIGMQSTLIDISKRKKAEESLQDRETELSAIIENIPNMLFLKDAKDLRFIRFNKTGETLLGRSREDIIGKNDNDFLPKEQAEFFMVKDREVLDSGQLLDIAEESIETPRGTRILHTRKVAIYDNNGKAKYLLGISEDITERKQIEHELENHRRHLEELVNERTATIRQQADIINQSHDSIISTNLKGIINSWNKGAEKLFGRPAVDAIGKHINIVYPPEEHDFLQQQVIRQLILKGQHEIEVRMWRSDHSLFEAHLSLSLLYGDDGKPVGMIGSSINISERKQIENALRKSEANLAHAQSIAHVGSWQLDIVNEQLSWSGETHRIFGLEEGKPVTLAYFNSCIHPEDSDKLWNAWSATLHGAPYDIEHRILVNGKEKWVKQQADVKFDSNGRAISALGTIQDISEHKAIERALAEAKQKAEASTRAKSKFLANMSHEIRTPLNAVLGFAKIGLRDSQNDETRGRFNHILDSGQHLLGVINDILDLSKIDAGKLRLESRTFQLIPTVEDTLDLIAEQAREKDLKFTMQLDPDLPVWVEGDSLRLRQILLNLLSNAIKFTEHGKVVFNIGREGEQIRFAVSDTGIGMNSEQISRLFIPFDQADTSTTRKYGGSGLGLTISHTLALLMGGEILVESEPGKGSTFTLSLPIPETEPGVEHLTHQMGTMHGSRLKDIHVLVAEDVELNRLILEDMLEYESARVTFAENGQHALDQLEEQGVTAFDIVLMDIQMPVMDGYEATRRVHEIAPALPVIGLTAHAMLEERDKCISAGMVEHITKPIDADVLVSAILRRLSATVPAEQKQAAVQTVPVADEVMPDSLPGIDMADGLKRVRGRWPTYKRLLLLFYNEYKTSADTMASLLAQGNIKEAEQLAHSLKGVSGTLGALQFHEETTLMEAACRSGEKDVMDMRMISYRSSLQEIIDGLAGLAEDETASKPVY